MTAAQTYTVDVVYHGRDQGAQGMADHIGVSLQGLQGRLDAVTSGMERLAMVGVAAIGGVAAMGVRTLARDMVHLNSITEDTTIGIAGMLQANGGAATFAAGMSQAGVALAQIRRDADALPGEAQDFVNVFSTALPAAMQAGMTNALDVARFTNQFAAVGIALHVDAEQSGRDLRLLLQGRAGAQVAMWNQLQSLVGKTAEQFNQMTAPQRLAALQRATGRYGDMVGAFGGTFSTAITTVIGRAHRLEELATKPLFDRATARLQEMGTYLTTHAPEIEARVVRWGEAGAHAFDVAYEHAARLFAYVRGHWREIVSDVKRAGRDFATVYGTLQGVRGAIGVGQAVGGIVQVASGIGAGAAGAGGALAIGALAVAAGSAALAIHDGAFDTQDALRSVQPAVSDLGVSLRDFATEWRPIVVSLGQDFLTNTTKVVSAFARLADLSLALGTAAGYVVNTFHLIRPAVPGWMRNDGNHGTSNPDMLAGYRDEHGLTTRQWWQQGLHRGPAADFDAFAPDPNAGWRNPVRSAGRNSPHPAAHNPTKINNTFNFKIEQADNPERVALSVMHVIRRELRNPTQSARPGVATLR